MRRGRRSSRLDRLMLRLLAVATVWVFLSWLLVQVQTSERVDGLGCVRGDCFHSQSAGAALRSPEELLFANQERLSALKEIIVDSATEIDSIEQVSHDRNNVEIKQEESDSVEQVANEEGKEEEEEDLVKFVDVRRGTKNKGATAVSRGNILPVASRVFGMNHWTITNVDPPKWPTYSWPFHPDKPGFIGIRLTHQPSPWIGDWGFFNILPLTTNNERDASSQSYDNFGAVLEPHYNKVRLTSQCQAGACTEIELAPTSHGGMLRIKFRPGPVDEYRLQLAHLDDLNAVALDATTIEFTGKAKQSLVFTNNRHRMLALQVVAQISSSAPVSNVRATIGPGRGGKPTLVWSSSEGITVTIRVGTSFISQEQARRVLSTELGFVFEDLVEQGRREWQQYLSRVVVEPDDSQDAGQVAELKTELYTCIFRGLLFPRQLGERNATGDIQHWSPYANGFRVFPGPLSTDSGFWDGYRTVYPMLHLLFPEMAAQVSEGWVNAIREDPGRLLAQWAAPNRLPSMVGSMGEVSMAEAIVNGALSPASAQDAYDYIKRSAFQHQAGKGGRNFLEEYKQYGFVPSATKRTETVSLSQNYYLTDFCTSLAAETMGDQGAASVLRERSKGWINLWDPETMFFREKSNAQSFSPGFDQYRWRGPYTEAGPWQYRFYVPHDPKGLRREYEAAGNKLGKSAKHGSHMCDKLNEMMTGPNSFRGQRIHEALEMQQHSFGQYSHNNQPSHHILYMFAHAGCAFEGQKWIHHTLRTQYGKEGFAGDEDNGEMASWYTLSSIGLYALVPGSGKYQVGAPPLFKTVTIRRGGAYGTLKIRRKMPVFSQPTAKFQAARSVSWRGQSHDLASDAVSISYKELLQGGELVFH